jgi:hypothetical protein
MKLSLALSGLTRVLMLVPMLLAWPVHAQDAKPFNNEQLEQMTAQVALYPDSLLAQLFMATTYPDDFAAAARWSKAHPDAKGDEAVTQVQNEPWDPSVASLVAFPEVLITLGEKSDWVRNMGDAFLAQPEDVMNAVQRLRQKAQAAGNLKSNEQIKVATQAPEPAPAPTTTVVQQSAPPAQVIVIEPAQPSVVYVPAYNPTVVYGAWPYAAYPPYYYPPPPGYWFSRTIATGIAWGVGIGVSNALWGGCNRSTRQHAVSRWRRHAQESRKQARCRQSRAVPRQGCEPRCQPRQRHEGNGAAWRGRRQRLGARPRAGRRPRPGETAGAGCRCRRCQGSRAERGSRSGPAEGRGRRSRCGTVPGAVRGPGQCIEGREWLTGEGAGRPWRIEPESG